MLSRGCIVQQDRKMEIQMVAISSVLISLFVGVSGAPMRVMEQCYLPCVNITVDATNVRDVFVTSCRINRVYVRGDATTVRVHSLDKKHKHCGKSFIETIIFLSLLLLLHSFLKVQINCAF